MSCCEPAMCAYVEKFFTSAPMFSARTCEKKESCALTGFELCLGRRGEKVREALEGEGE